MAGRVRAPLRGAAPGSLRVTGDLAHYLARVLRLATGDTFVAYDPSRGTEHDAEVVAVDHGTVALTLGPARPGAVRAARAVGWIQGLAKGDKCDAVVRDATELGASRIVVADTARSVLRLDGPKAVARVARWARVAEEAARQAGRADVPEVVGVLSFDAALALAGEGAARFCLDPRAEAPLGPALFAALATEAPVWFVVGAEGGLTDEEVRAATARDFLPVSLGRFVLRTETVAAAVLGAVRVASLEG